MNGTKWNIVADVEILSWWLPRFDCKANILKPERNTSMGGAQSRFVVTIIV